MAAYNVTEPDFVKAQRGFDRVSTELQRTMHTLEGQLLGSLLNRTGHKAYRGGQADAFGHTYEIIRGEMEAAIKELMLMAELVKSAKGNYTQADSQTSQDYKKVASKIPVSGGRYDSRLNPV